MLILALAAGAAGCTNAALSAARSEMAAGNYAVARQHLLQARESSGLSVAERREVNDRLCLADFKIGAPTFPLAEQYRVCAAAAAQPQSQSGLVLAQIEAFQRYADSAQVETELKRRDLAGAQSAMIAYSRTPGADPAQIARWSQELWKELLVRDAAESKARRRLVAPTIAEMARRYPGLRAGSEEAFKAWVRKTASADGAPLISSAVLKKGSLELGIDDRMLDQTRLNLDRFVTVNNGLVARCRCDAHTDIGVAQSGLPLYMVRIDPLTRTSEVLVLPRP